ncbi:MAG: metalloregulator ArsR/SmtB family transcription factor [Fervidobacterium sp.]|uniref:Transcriptional regulator, ArsR family n=1 Tax=Fervidobacterium gondwanense DSM 13020 TaxID=1121883 RepID=A0A1M7TA25_FERGO|nr:metalloregulator ArsR/SmtB family transcription factor [Fervidobacterium gondwanense]UXF01019.1 ArsR family transcriptional regulator [Fervidobacterium riparium]SHN67572.1 transcriptional regulator, ArsR family [Fervidobacterium gondwanense DSM 13020]
MVENLEKYAETLKVIAHPIRLQILMMLKDNEKLCVCEMLPRIGISQPNLSQHLSMMRLSGLVETEKKGNMVFYKLSDNRFLKEFLDLIDKYINAEVK